MVFEQVGMASLMNLTIIIIATVIAVEILMNC